MLRTNVLHYILAMGLGFMSAAAQSNTETDNSCSAMKYIKCHADAICLEENGLFSGCKCPDWLDGDGYKGDDQTGCGPQKCKLNKDCVPNAFCDEFEDCMCNKGYQGDGWLECHDIDECLDRPCHPKADCENNPGGYECTCKMYQNYVGNGLECNRTCGMDVDCDKNETCNGAICVCKAGYKPEPITKSCVDTNECEENNPCDANAKCDNTVGGYTCTCNNGYSGNGEVCKVMPKNCHEILLENRKSNSGFYDVDPDGEGPLGKIEVECEMRSGLGITIVPLVDPKSKRFNQRRITRTYTYTHDITIMRAIIKSSEFCFQEQSSKAVKGAKLMDGDDFWRDYTGARQENWGGSETTGYCACGSLGYCLNRESPCNADGTNETVYDSGKIMKDEILPVTEVTFETEIGYADIFIGALMCSPRPFDFPIDCNDAKYNRYYKIKTDGPQFIDVDGPEGPLKPILVHCDMESHNHVGVTIIPHTSTEFVTPTGPGRFEIFYKIDEDRLNRLIEISDFCSQYAEYECTNSRLMNGGDKKGFFSDIRGDEKNYWPGGLGEEYKCGCGITDTCSSGAFCNCDVKDGQTRKDLGQVIDKDDLPIGSITLLELGGNSNGTYRVGPLKCSRKQFGIPATCNDYVEEGFTTDYTYLVDPDGPEFQGKGQLAPFSVHCKFTGDPLYATTVVHHHWRQKIEFIGEITFTYVRVSVAQITALTTRAVSCTQTISFDCLSAPLHESGNEFVQWFSKDGHSYSYYAGNGTASASCTCGQTEPSSCVNGLECNCDAADQSQRTDFGLLTNKLDLPVMLMVSSVDQSAQSEMYLEVGPLECREIFPNCADIKAFDTDKFDSENKMKNGEHVVDPDGPGGVEPFTVTCKGPQTTIPVDQYPQEPTESDPDNGVEKCYEVTYKSDSTGKPISPQQIQALVEISDFCMQTLKQECLNAPLTGHSTFTTCDGVEQPGWGGSLGEDKCACGVTGSCKGGSADKCNCDLEDGEMSEDSGDIVDKNRLAICSVCVSLNSTNSLPSNVDPKIRRVKPEVSELVCSSKPVGRGKSCQNWRDMGIVESGPIVLDVSGEPFTIDCGFSTYPPMGWTEIKPKEPEITVPSNGTNVTINYYVYNTQFILDLIEVSGYCTQEILLECEDSTFSLTGQQGFYSRDDERQSFWAGNEEGTSGCAGGECQCNLGGTRIDGGLVTDKRLLPIKRVVLGPASGNRTLKIGPVKCFDLYKDCEDIRKNKAKTNPLRNNVYAIDSDGPGRVEPFSVICDFKYARNLGITLVKVELEKYKAVRGYIPPLLLEIPVHYDSVTPEQIHALANISGYCHQGVQYVCRNSPLTDATNPTSGYYYTYGGVRSSGFGTAGHTSVKGCACKITDTCPEGHDCHCDADGKRTVDYGYENNRAAIPITKLEFGHQKDDMASATYDLTDVTCAPKPVYLPKDCEEVHERGLRTGEHLIMPSTGVDPYLVYCDMELLNKKGGVTVIGHKLVGERITVTYDETIELKYHDVDIPGINALTAISNYCFQAIKYECTKTKLLSDGGYFTWLDGTGIQQQYIGSGQWFKQECSCGKVGFCGGSENRTTLPGLNRRCSCDANDDKARADAGVYNSTDQLPIVNLLFSNTLIPGSVGYLTVGKLYCAKQDFDLNECKLGYHDCDVNAKCINTFGDFECECRSGWRGLGRPDVWANGRDCYDDDECAMNLCPWSADCLNLPGSYQCDCRKGFTQTGKRRCQDIDECQLNTHNCDENARCYNTIGSFECRCNRNYRGNGTSCAPLALCACFGDPHCLSLDGILVDYQGQCQYVMSRDKCDDLESIPTYEILTTFKPRSGVQTAVTWVKEVTVNVYNYTILLMQNNEVRVDGLTVIDFRTEGLSIRRSGKTVEIRTNMGLELLWDGEEVIEVYVPGHFAGTTCGLCGNYNGDSSDDLMVGPMCGAEPGEVTDNFNLFGDSWAVESYVSQYPECFTNCSGPEEPVCDGPDLALAKLSCNKVFSPTGIFKDCLKIMDHELLVMLREACIYDGCFVDGEVCKFAAMVVNMCQNQYGEVIGNFRSEHFCNINCGENMEYQICGNSNQWSCSDVVTDNYQDVSTTQCNEGCFCKEGFVLDGDICVLPEECGCFYKGRYYKVGEEVIDGKCNEKDVCLQDGTMHKEEGIECHEFATCTLRDGYHGCHCFEGYYGDGIETCIPDPCIVKPCGENEVCVKNSTVTAGYVCQCAMGYNGDCGNCTDTDECKTLTYECPYRSECENTIGSYICKCETGYTMEDGKCVDINECTMAALSGTQVCGNNSKCSNKIGTHECVCCAGFQRDENGDCVESGSSSEEGPKCCTCTSSICDKPGKVCGTDGNEYNTIGEMMIHNCEHDLTHRTKVRVDYKGRCRNSCNKVKCPMYQNCSVIDDKPTCICEPCTEEEKKTTEPVCTPKLTIYPDYCTFKKVQCMFDAEIKPLDSMIPCEGKGHGKPITPWSEWSECSVSCGKGTSTKTREALIPLNSKQKEKYPLSQETDCYAPPCPEGPCDVEKPCENDAAECFENENGDAECECPSCENQLDPVCGYLIGTSESFTEGTYTSACHLQQEACEDDIPEFEVMHTGPCGVEPLNCTRVPYSDYIHDKDDPSYVSDDTYNLFDCDGGCGRSTDKCCKPADTEELTVTLSNGQDTKETTVQVIKSCECEYIPPPQA